MKLPRRTMQEDYLIDIDGFYKFLKNAEEPLDISGGYILGIVIVLNCLTKEDPAMINKFITLNESVNFKSEIECLEIIGMCLDQSDSTKEAVENFQKRVAKVSKSLSKEDCPY